MFKLIVYKDNAYAICFFLIDYASLYGMHNVSNVKLHFNISYYVIIA